MARTVPGGRGCPAASCTCHTALLPVSRGPASLEARVPHPILRCRRSLRDLCVPPYRSSCTAVCACSGFRWLGCMARRSPCRRCQHSLVPCNQNTCYETCPPETRFACCMCRTPPSWFHLACPRAVVHACTEKSTARPAATTTASWRNVQNSCPAASSERRTPIS